MLIYQRAWLSIFCVCIVMFIGGSVLRLAAKDAALETRGVHIAATICSLHIDDGKKGRDYVVDYEFSPAPGVEPRVRGYVSRVFYENAKIGDQIEAVYDPTAPTNARLSRFMPDDGGHPYLSVLHEWPIVLLPLIAIPMVWFV